jgi:peptide/nickel transport system substrate-binding protein
MTIRRSLAALVWAAALGSAPDVAFAQAAAAKPVLGGTLTFGLATDTAVIDPAVTASAVTALITRNVVDSLVGQAPDNRFTPWLATSWTINADNTIYTFHLRSDVTFSDGTKLDAAAVKYNFERVLDPKTTSSYAKSLLGPVASIEAPDSATLIIRYKMAFAPLLQGLSLPYLGIQSPKALQAVQGAANSIVGSGPFLLQSFVKGSGSALTRRADYHWGPGYAAHQGPAFLDRILFRYLPESSVRLGALTSGQVQAISEVPPVEARRLASNPAIALVDYQNPGVVQSLFLNTTKPPFDDVRLRQAFQSAANIPAIVRAIYFGTLQPADNILSPRTLYYDPTIAHQWGYDPARTAKLLDAAGWGQRSAQGIRVKDGKPLTVRFVYDTTSLSALDVTLFQAIQAAERQIGFDFQLVPTDAGGFADHTAHNDYDTATIYYVRAEPDILRVVFDSAYIPPNGMNLARVSTLDAPLQAAIGGTAEARRKLYADVQSRIIQEAYAVPVGIAAYHLGESRRLHGISWATNAKPLFYDAWLAP